MARNHRGNPAASLRVEACYSAPKLFNGLASLLLSPSLPAPALAHKHQFTLRHMVALLGSDNILY